MLVKSVAAIVYMKVLMLTWSDGDGVLEVILWFDEKDEGWRVVRQ